MKPDPDASTASTRRSGSEMQQLLLTGWRERWSDVQFGLRVKQVLPRGVSGDVYDLSDCLVHQMLIGPSPNMLMHCYLKHCLSAGIVSCASVMSCISGTDAQFGNTQSVSCLLDLVTGMLEQDVTCQSNEVRLAVSLVQVAAWSLRCLRHATTVHSQPQVAEQVLRILSAFCRSPFLMSLLHVGQQEEQCLTAAWTEWSEWSAGPVAEQVLRFREAADRDVHETACRQVAGQAGLGMSEGFSALSAVTAFNAVLTPVSDVTLLSQQLVRIADLHHMSRPLLVMHLIRASFVGLVDAGSSAAAAEELKWSAFTFLKLPDVLHRMLLGGEVGPEKRESVRETVAQAVRLLLTYSPLLDQTDQRLGCDSVQLLVKELRKLDLVPQEMESLQRTESVSAASHMQSQASLILKAEPTVTSILKTLDVDYSKNLDGLLSVLCKMQGKSFQLIVTAAAATHKLHFFAMKLLLFNESNKQATCSETGKTRSLIFDITFLMLCHICQHYGSAVVTGIPETRSCFFAQWVAQCLPQDGRHRCPDAMLTGTGSVLMQQLTRPDFDVMRTEQKWDEVCLSLPAAIGEILSAWQSDGVTTETVKQVLDNVKCRMCCLPIVVSAFLSSHISLLHHSLRLKPQNMLQQFLVPCAADSLTDGDCYYKERSALMTSVVRNILNQLVQTKSTALLCHRLTGRTPLAEVLEQALFRHWPDSRATHDTLTAVSAGGAEWFVHSLLLHSSDVSLIFGLMHVRLQECASALLSHLLPHVLLSASRQELLFEPRASALARLSVLSLFAALPLPRPRSSARDPDLLTQLQDTPFLLTRQQDHDHLMDPFVRSVARLMLLLSHLVSDADVSQRTLFPLIFLQQLLLCGQQQAKQVTQFLPVTTAMHLVRLCPHDLSFEFLVAVSDVSTSTSRRHLSRALCQLRRSKRLA